jgi:hypothetical protein
MPDSLLRTIEFLPNKPTSGWWFYASDRMSLSFRPPEATRVVDVPGRGSIVIVTEEQFTTQNPAHLDARNSIQTAVAAALTQ